MINTLSYWDDCPLFLSFVVVVVDDVVVVDYFENVMEEQRT